MGKCLARMTTIESVTQLTAAGDRRNIQKSLSLGVEARLLFEICKASALLKIKTSVKLYCLWEKSQCPSKKASESCW
jgi:hypothetical protein